MLYITYFNLKKGVNEEEFVKKTKEFSEYFKDRIEGFGSDKLYRHHNGANPRMYQMHSEMKDYGAWDRFLGFIEKDAKGARLLQEWRKLVELNTHFDEFAKEIPL